MRIRAIVYFLFSLTGIRTLSQSPKDTLFLFRQVSDSSYHAIFVDHNPRSVFYNETEKFITLDSVLYHKTIKALLDSGFKILHVRVSISRDWYSLYRYRG